MTGLLPDGILRSSVRYIPNGMHGKPMLVLPFRTELTARQIRQIADVIAEYTRVQTGTYQEVVPVTDDLLRVRNSIDAVPPLNSNYRIFQDTSNLSELVQARIYILAESRCIEPKTLETFVKDVILQ